MTPEQLQEITELRSRPIVVEFAKSNVDVENGVLRDVVMVQEGEASGHAVHLESEFISDLVAYDQRVFGDDGVKSRFGHVFGLAAMGSQLGYFRNVRKREKGGKMQAIGDLHLLKSADKSPTRPGMYSYVLELAQEAPDFIMSSIVFKAGRYYQRKGNGHKKYIWEYAETNPDGSPRWDSWVWKDQALGKVYVEFGSKGEHYYTDLVDDGAATDNLFHSTPATPEKPKPIAMKSLKELLFGKEKTEETTLSAEQITELRDKMTQAETALSDAQTNLGKAEDKVKQLEKSLSEKETELQTATARVKELEEKPGATHDLGQRENNDDKDEKPSWLSSPANRKAAEAYARKQAAKKDAA